MSTNQQTNDTSHLTKRSRKSKLTNVQKGKKKNAQIKQKKNKTSKIQDKVDPNKIIDCNYCNDEYSEELIDRQPRYLDAINQSDTIIDSKIHTEELFMISAPKEIDSLEEKDNNTTKK